MMTKEDYKKQFNIFQSMRNNVKKDKNRLHYHLMPPIGWLNDPNGLCQKDGIYHIYYQYSPFDGQGGVKLWGHYTSKDMITFKEEEPFLFPDTMIDKEGVYSGSAFVEDNTIYYFYTGNVKLIDKKDYDYIHEGREQNTICCKSQDGFFISEKKLIMSNEQYPTNMSKHVRDPKIFKKDNDYYMVLGARTSDDQGCVLLYKSQDLKNFQYYNTIKTPTKFGYMWECPDLFELDGHLFLVVCPQGLEQNGYNYENIYQCGYFEVNYDFYRNTYTLSEFKELDHGFDIYAPQSFVDEKGRRIQYSWMGIPDADYHNQPTLNYDWQHALTIPKVIIYKDNQLFQQPIEEMKLLREKEYQIQINEFNKLNIQEISFEMNIKFDYSEDFNIQLREDVHLKYQNQILTLSLGSSGCGRNKRHLAISYILSLTIYSDTSSLEIFINEGQEVMTTRVYSLTKQQPQFITKHKGKISFYSLNGYKII